MWGAKDKWDEPEKKCVGLSKEKECVGLHDKEDAMAEDLGELPGSFFLKNDVNLAEVPLEASFLQWAALSVWAV